MSKPTFYAQIPKMACDDLNPYQLALYNRYAQACGATNTPCTKANETLALECKMSVRNVQIARKALQTMGYIYVAPRTGKTNAVTLIDVWQMNHARYTGGAPHAQGYAPDAPLPMQNMRGGYAPDAPKEQPNNKNHKQEKPIINKQHTPDPDATPAIDGSDCVVETNFSEGSDSFSGENPDDTTASHETTDSPEVSSNAKKLIRVGVWPNVAAELATTYNSRQIDRVIDHRRQHSYLEAAWVVSELKTNDRGIRDGGGESVDREEFWRGKYTRGEWAAFIES